MYKRANATRKEKRVGVGGRARRDRKVVVQIRKVPTNERGTAGCGGTSSLHTVQQRAGQRERVKGKDAREHAEHASNAKISRGHYYAHQEQHQMSAQQLGRSHVKAVSEQEHRDHSFASSGRWFAVLSSHNHRNYHYSSSASPFASCPLFSRNQGRPKEKTPLMPLYVVENPQPPCALFASRSPSFVANCATRPIHPFPYPVLPFSYMPRPPPLLPA